MRRAIRTPILNQSVRFSRSSGSATRQSAKSCSNILAASAATYAVALVIQRRAFKGIPGEDAMHIALEEASELMAHLLLLVGSVVGRWRRR